MQAQAGQLQRRGRCGGGGHSGATRQAPGQASRPGGAQISFWRGFWRYFAFIFVFVFTLGIGLVIAAFSERKRALHDMMCGTLVVDKWAYSNRPELQTRGLDTVSKVVLAIYAALIALAILFVMLAIGLAIAGQA